MSIKCTEHFYASTSKEDIKVRYLVWKEESNKNPIGVIQLTHGWGERIDRYDEMAKIGETYQVNSAEDFNNVLAKFHEILLSDNV